MPSAEYQRKWRKKNRKKVAQYMRTWRAKHPEQALAYQRKWTDENRAKVNSLVKKWYRNNRKLVSERAKAARKKNPEKYKEYERNRKRDYRLKVIYRRRHYLKYKERVCKQTAEYQRKHPEVGATTQSRRRARLRAGGQHTTAEWMEKVRRFKWRCAYCRKRLVRRTLTKDHFIPLVKGGTDNIDNVVPACSPCNHLKHVKLGWVVCEPPTP